MCEAEVVVLDAAVSPASKLIAQLVPNDHNEASDLADSHVRLFAIPETGQIRFVITGLGLLCGPFTLNYGVAS
jgi:nitric oxide synthase oxygenase domain/subunit